VVTITSRHNRPISPDEQMIYDHLLQCIEVESPDEMLARFKLLFIDGVHYPHTEVVAALDRVTSSRLAEEEFRFVLNRCCHILINRWQARSQSQLAIPRLIDLFETANPSSYAGFIRSRFVTRLRQLNRQFTQTEQYLKLRRLAQILTQNADGNTYAGTRPLGTLIHRYPYLYEHCLLSEDSAFEQQSTVRQIQRTAQHQFEINLSQYVTYQVRQEQAASNLILPQQPRLIQPVTNPTLLEDREFKRAIKHYVGRVEGSRTYRDLAHSFLMQSGHSQTFRAFKDDLYSYITAGVDPEYGKRQFNNQLHAYLRDTLPDSDSRILDDFLIVRTCSNLLNFLVVGGQQQASHFIFVDLLNNLGPVLTTGLLLKIVLLCRKVRPVLERRFSILFGHYESCTRDAVQWLVSILENLNVALSAHFGSIDLSFVH
jgi:hypothetical protein